MKREVWNEKNLQPHCFIFPVLFIYLTSAKGVRVTLGWKTICSGKVCFHHCSTLTATQKHCHKRPVLEMHEGQSVNMKPAIIQPLLRSQSCSRHKLWFHHLQVSILSSTLFHASQKVRNGGFLQQNNNNNLSASASVAKMSPVVVLQLITSFMSE